MTIREDDVLKMAKLARVSLSESEKHIMAENIDKLVGYMNQVAELDLDNVEPMMRPDEKNLYLRPDEPKKGLSREDAFKNAPAENRNHFSIPKVIP